MENKVDNLFDLCKYYELNEYSKSIIFYVICAKSMFEIEKADIFSHLLNIAFIERDLAEKITEDIFNLNEISKIKMSDNIITDTSINIKGSYVGILLLECNKIDREIATVLINDNFNEVFSKIRNLNFRFLNLNIYYRNITIKRLMSSKSFTFESNHSLFHFLEKDVANFIRFLENTSKNSNNKNNELIKVNLKFLVNEFHLKFNVLRFVLSFLVFLESPFYENSKKDLVEDLFKIMSEILFNTELHDIYIEQSDFLKEKNINLRGSKDKTTHVQIFFSLENMDVFCLRFDLPHKGEPYLHFNLHEIGRESGIPLRKDEYADCVKEYKDLDNIFFEFENKYWFRNRFLEKLEKSELENEKKEKFKLLFKEKSHLKIADVNDNEELFLETFSHLKKIFYATLGNNTNVMPKECVDIDDKLFRIALKLKIKAHLYDYMLDSEDEKLLRDNCIKLLYDVYKLDIGIEKKDLISLDFTSLIDVIFDFINE